MSKGRYTLLTTLLVLLSMPAWATRIGPGSTAGLATGDYRAITAAVFKFSPFPPSHSGIVPGFSDPLGTGIDPSLKIFDGSVQVMDFLGDFLVPQPEDIANVDLPAGTMDGAQLLDSLLSTYLTGKKRSFDRFVLNVQESDLKERDGLPVTRETSPLSLAGFGSVTDFHKPINTHWTRCPASEKRIRMMTEMPRSIRSRFKPNPITCYRM